MDLDELKNAWASVDERLKGSEMLNKRIVQEMLSDKSNKSLNKLVNYEMFNVIVLLLVIPFCVWILYTNLINFLFPKIIVVTGILFSVFEIILRSYILKKYLLKMDFFKSIKENIYYMNKFSIYYKKWKMITYCIIIPIVSLLCVLCYYELKASFHLWIFLFAALIVAFLITYWTYKKIYEVNIQSIQKSLEELSELKEE
jgi:hypothetical protein